MVFYTRGAANICRRSAAIFLPELVLTWRKLCLKISPLGEVGSLLVFYQLPLLSLGSFLLIPEEVPPRWRGRRWEQK